MFDFSSFFYFFSTKFLANETVEMGKGNQQLLFIYESKSEGNEQLRATSDESEPEGRDRLRAMSKL